MRSCSDPRPQRGLRRSRLHDPPRKDGVEPNDFNGSSWWARQDSNLHLTDYESAALTIELRAHQDRTGRPACRLTQAISTN